MQDLDSALKDLFMGLTPRAFAQLTGFEVTAWLNPELPRFGMQRVDLPGKSARGALFHIEFQSTNVFCSSC